MTATTSWRSATPKGATRWPTDPAVGSHAAGADDSLADERGLGTAGREGDQEAVRPGERTTRLKRYVVTERVVQTVEELPDDDPH